MQVQRQRYFLQGFLSDFRVGLKEIDSMQTKFKRLAGVLVLAMGMGSQVTASAGTVETLFDNLSQSTNNATTLNGPDDWAASLFSTGIICSSGCELGDITLSLQANNGVLNDLSGLSVSIYDAAPNQPGASIIGTMSNPGSIGVVFQDIVFQPIGSIELADNTDYWVQLTQTPATSNPVAWEHTPWLDGEGIWSIGIFDGALLPNNSYIMKVEATPLSAVPIPPAFWLMGSALLGLVFQGRREEV